MQQYGPVCDLQHLPVYLEVVAGRPSACGQRPAGHDDDLGAVILHETDLIGVGLDDRGQPVPPWSQLVGTGSAGNHHAELGGPCGGAGDQFPRLTVAEPHSALRRVHRLGYAESVAPQVLAEGHRGVPVDAPVGKGGDVRGCVHAPADGRRIGGLPAGIGNLHHAGPAWQGDHRAHLRPPVGGPPPGGPQPRPAVRARQAGRLWRHPPDPTGTAGPAQRPRGTAPTAP